jgi:glutathione synthase/RimK-type ligase-like ATP-grasp enzyme
VLLIVTNREDRTSDWLVAELHRRGAPFARFNTEDYPRKTALRWTPTGGHLRLPTVEVDLRDVTAVWYRRPVPPVEDPELDAGRNTWAIAESREALEGVWRSLDCLWVNHPDANAAASSKPAQLKLANELGLNVPPTLVTNDPNEARAFVGLQDGAVVKPLRSGRIDVEGDEHLFFTSRITPDDDIPWDRMGREPYLFQRFIAKTADIRLTIIGDDAFAVRIDSQRDPDTRTDFRRSDPTRLPHKATTLPPDVERACVALVHGSGCQFGAIDLAETDDGYWFFENNPNGQWAWIEQLTGLPLRRSLADLLTGSIK